MPSLSQRSAGVLLHVTSLPGPHGCGDAGPVARAFVDSLARARVGWWQMLPTHPVGRGPGFSPYSSPSAFAVSPLVVSPDDLVARGLVGKRDIRAAAGLGGGKVDYPGAIEHREGILRRAVAAFVSGGGKRSREFAAFEKTEGDWLGDWALFAAARRACGAKQWHLWPDGLAKRRARALAEFTREHAAEVEYHTVAQFLAEQQWRELREYAAASGVGLIGDVPIFVSHDSADVWAHPHLFKLDAHGMPKVVTGVPPDIFSKLGQKWNHPHYAWARHAATGFSWFTRRFERVLTGFDVVRIDHFLGFNRAWEIPGTAKDARKGQWAPTPGRELFTALRKRTKGRVGSIIAEDLGDATAGATKLREDFKFPGMRVLQFGFGGGTEHLPFTYPPSCVAYTGTHDNETCVQWAQRVSKPKGGERDALRALGVSGEGVAWRMVGMVANSAANTAVFPVQDLLELGGEARMNVPGTAEGNWRWRMAAGGGGFGGGLGKDVEWRLRKLLEVTKRAGETV